jgi:hypothetical protein
VTDLPLLPTDADRDRFWQLIDMSWQDLGPEPNTLRHAVTRRDPDGDDTDPDAVDPWFPAFFERLRARCADMSGPELTDLDRVLERSLHDIDREDIQAVTDGSDDGFLYARGFVVALGREFYEAVTADPRSAVEDAECEQMCYFFAHLHQERFGSWPQTGAGISRESFSNPAGWNS